MNYTQEEYDDILLASQSVHYFAGLCLPEVYKQQKHLLDTYFADEHSLAFVSRQCGNTTIQAIYVLWCLIFKQDKTIGYTTTNSGLCESFISSILEINEKLPEHLKAKFDKLNRYTLVSINKTRIIAKPMNINAFRGMTLSTLIIDLFHFQKKKNFYEFMQCIYPCLIAYQSKIIMSTNINPHGFKLYDFISDFNINQNFWVTGIPYNKCSNYSEVLDKRYQLYNSAEFYLAEYCCTDREGIVYA